MGRRQKLSGGPSTMRAWVVTKSGRDFEVALPAKRIVCGRCDGRGSHVNPAIDEHGIDPQEFRDDPDFEEGYFSGRYDVRCEECHGERVIDIVDEEKLTPKMRERWHRHLDQEAAHRRECEMERRMGA